MKHDPPGAAEAFGAYVRRLTGWARPWPEFIIAGAQKSGTTSLFWYLSKHPQLLPSRTKEVHFFDGGNDPAVDTYAKGPGWYRSHFPLRLGAARGRKPFEASPRYLFSPVAPARIARHIPRAKIIVLLRDPVERAISPYFHNVARGRELLPIADAIRAEEDRLRPSLEAGDSRSEAVVHFSYKARGRYHEQLRRFMQFFPPENLLVIRAETFFSDTAPSLRGVLDFIGVDPGADLGDLSPQNTRAHDAPVPDSVRRDLRRYFAPHNRALYGLVGQDYGWPLPD